MLVVKNLISYPLKSGQPISLPATFVNLDGFADDRRMMVVNEAGLFVTAREFPKLLSIAVTCRGERIIFSAPGTKSLELNLADLRTFPLRQAEIWGELVQMHDGGDHVAAWLTSILGLPVRLMAQATTAPRPFDSVSNGQVSLADTAPILLVNDASLANLNLHLSEPTSILQFRPNIVLTGGEAFAEDSWQRLRVGALEFQITSDCSRCVLTTIDPFTGVRHPGGEPMRSMSRLRHAKDDRNNNVNFGVYLAPCEPGLITVGDEVEVIERRPPRQYVLPSLVGIEPPRPEPIVTRDRKFECVGVVAETSDTKTYELRPKDGRLMRYHAGQFVVCHLPMKSGTESRSFTLSSSPERGSIVQITAKRHRCNGAVAWMHEKLRPGQVIGISGPFGKLHLNGIPKKEKLAFFAAGSGVTPFLSMLRDLADRGERRNIFFHYSVRQLEDCFFASEIKDLVRRSGGLLRFECHIAESAGRLDAATLPSLCDDLQNRQVFCCGPEGYMSMIRGAFPDHSASGRYHEESFSGTHSTDPIGTSQPYQVTFSRSGQTLSGDQSNTILTIARKAGIALSSSCEVGVCGNCRCRVTIGNWTLSANCADPERSVLSENEKQEGYVLACTTVPHGYLEIDL